MIGSTRISGADQSANNQSGNNYVPSVQASTGRRSKAHKIIVSQLQAADLYLWVFDTANGGSASAGPRVVMLCPGGLGVCSTLDLGDGKPFVAGIYLALSTTAPTDATTTPTATANNAAIVEVDFHLE